MLECETEYGFLITSDEIIFIHFAPTEMGSGLTVLPDGKVKRRKWISSMVKPELWYSEPIKHRHVLHQLGGTVPVKLALLHLIHLTTINEFRMIESKGNCAKYFPTTAAGEKFRLSEQGFSRPG